MLDRPAIDTRQRAARVSRARLCRWSLAAAAGFVVLYLAAVATAAGQRLDDAVMRLLSASTSYHRWAELVLHWVSAGSLLGLSASLGLGTWLLRGRVVALLGLLATGTIVVAAQVLKLLLQRPVLLTEPATNSFPSGHVAVVAGLAAAVVVGVAPGTARRVTLVLLTPVVGLAGLATVVLQWHRPSDVLGSVLLSVAIGGLAVLLADGRAARRADRRDAPAPDRSPAPTALLTPPAPRRVGKGLRTGPRG